MPGSLKSPVPAAKWFFALYLIAGVCGWWPGPVIMGDDIGIFNLSAYHQG